jgi:hypothetical protein
MGANKFAEKSTREKVLENRKERKQRSLTGKRTKKVYKGMVAGKGRKE